MLSILVVIIKKEGKYERRQVVLVVQDSIPEKWISAKCPKAEKSMPCRRVSQGKDPDVLLLE